MRFFHGTATVPWRRKPGKLIILRYLIAG